jgi:sRNA-binding protein
MKVIRASIAVLLLFALCFPARGDFKYTETTQITGGAMMGMATFAAKFSKTSRDAFKPTVTTRYVKGNRMRNDNADGTAQIIDLDGRQIINIDSKNRTYSITTFEEMKAAMEKAQKDLQEKMAEKQPAAAKTEDPQINVKPKITVLPAGGNRVILGLPATETKVQMDMEMEAKNTGQAPPPQPGQPTSITFSMLMDTWVAPDVPGYKEIGQFYVKMAKEVNWVPPVNIHVDPRMTQGMSELQKNSAALRGLPMLSYVSMTIPPGQGQGNATASGNQNPPPGSSSSSNDSTPASPSDAVMKGLGGLFAKKKQKDDAAAQNNGTALPPNPNPVPNALMEMTTQVSSFSDSSLDGSLFEVPAGYTKTTSNADQMLSTRPSPK